jgi:hypothetical protein
MVTLVVSIVISYVVCICVFKIDLSVYIDIKFLVCMFSEAYYQYSRMKRQLNDIQVCGDPEVPDRDCNYTEFCLQNRMLRLFAFYFY